jgi:transcriptional regulator with XRE-family HTH domain
MENQNSDPCSSTVDRNGVPYQERLKRIRESAGMSISEVAESLNVPLRDVYEWEGYEGELNSVASLGALAKLAAVLGKPTRLIFDDDIGDGQSLSPEQLAAKIKAYLNTSGMSLAEFEEKIGWIVEPALRDPAEVLNWDVDCLRFVCAEVGVDWRMALS